MFPGNKNEVRISGTEQERNNLKRVIILNSEALMNATAENARRVAQAEVSRLVSEFRLTKNPGALGAAAALISFYGLDSSALESALDEAKKQGLATNYDINAAILHDMLKYDYFIASLSSWNKMYEEAEELKKRTEDMLKQIDQNPEKAEDSFKGIRSDFLKNEKEALKDSAVKASTLTTNLEGAKKLKEEAIIKKSHPDVVKRIDKQIKDLEEHYDREAEKNWGNYQIHSMNEIYKASSHLSSSERMANVKADHEASLAIEKPCKHILMNRLAERAKDKDKFEPIDIYAEIQQIKAEHIKQQSSPILQSPSAVRAANIAEIVGPNLRPADRPQPVSFNVAPTQQPAVQQPSVMHNQATQVAGVSSANLDLSFKPEPVTQKPAVQSPTASSQMLLSPAEDKNVKEIGAGMKSHVKYQAPVQEKSEIKEKEIPAVQANKQAVKDAGLDEEELAALRPTKPKAGPAAAQAGAAPGHKHQDSLARNDQGQGYSR